MDSFISVNVCILYREIKWIIFRKNLMLANQSEHEMKNSVRSYVYYLKTEFSFMLLKPQRIHISLAVFTHKLPHFIMTKHMVL